MSVAPERRIISAVMISMFAGTSDCRCGAAGRAGCDWFAEQFLERTVVDALRGGRFEVWSGRIVAAATGQPDDPEREILPHNSRTSIRNAWVKWTPALIAASWLSTISTVG